MLARSRAVARRQPLKLKRLDLASGVCGGSGVRGSTDACHRRHSASRRGPAKASRHQLLTQGLSTMAHSVVRHHCRLRKPSSHHCRKAHAASIGLGMASCNGYSNSCVPLEAARWRAGCERKVRRAGGGRRTHSAHGAPTRKRGACSSEALNPCKTSLCTIAMTRRAN